MNNFQSTLFFAAITASLFICQSCTASLDPTVEDRITTTTTIAETPSEDWVDIVIETTDQQPQPSSNDDEDFPTSSCCTTCCGPALCYSDETLTRLKQRHLLNESCCNHPIKCCTVAIVSTIAGTALASGLGYLAYYLALTL
jgi:hypothetical protein